MKARKKKLCLSNDNILIFHSTIPMPNFSFFISNFSFLTPRPRKIQFIRATAGSLKYKHTYITKSKKTISEK